MKPVPRQSEIIQWSIEKGINNPEKQYLKFLEEVGELAGSILRGNMEGIKDGIGDTVVTVVILDYLQTDKEATQYSEVEEFCLTTYGLMASLVCNCDFFTMDVNLTYCAINRIAENFGFTIEECVEHAWNQIKDRTGKTVDGSFIKHGDMVDELNDELLANDGMR